MGETIGFTVLGIMGRPMAAKLLRSRGQGGDHSALLSLVEDLAEHRIGESILTATA